MKSTISFIQVTGRTNCTKYNLCFEQLKLHECGFA
jgi:hypothetical protein